jgi:hypothetical protein
MPAVSDYFFACGKSLKQAITEKSYFERKYQYEQQADSGSDDDTGGTCDWQYFVRRVYTSRYPWQ